MSENSCPREREVTRALVGASWTEELRSHVAACEICSDTVAIAGALAEVKEELPADVMLPDYRVLLMAAQVRKRQAQAARIDLIARLATGALAAIAVMVLYLGWVRNAAWKGAGSTIERMSGLIHPTEPMLVIFVVGIGLVWILTREKRREFWV